MAKDRERNTARILYVNEGKSGKEIALMLNIAEKTVSAWVEKYAWKSARTAKVTSSDNRIANLKRIIDDIAEERLQLQAELADLTKTKSNEAKQKAIRIAMAAIDGTVAQWNNVLINAEKETKITLGVYLTVMQRVFKAMYLFDAVMHNQTIAFQDQHINDITIELG